MSDLMKELIQSKFDEAINYINTKREVYREIYTNPEIIITKLFNPKESKSYYDLGEFLSFKQIIKI